MNSKHMKYLLAGIIIVALLIGSYLLGKNSKQTVLIKNHLTPSLTTFQFKENVDALITQNAPVSDLQEYIGNYQKDSSGNFVLKSSVR